MGDDGEKTCPLCAEEMDLTDQQLKPCKCGYEICVWCWHHIMDMAEKDDSEGRCPACRSPYDKEKIVAMAANCGRLVAEINSERKLKSQKAKAKTSEGRKQLSSIRVIQRNLVYIIGLPLDLADEELLQCKEYFGQYGKVLKVSISRTSGGAIQHSSNNTCSVYITYSKEEEAVRCIQSVHGFILDGRPLKACFGTTKYCHAWLRNMPCSNPDCLYLHEIGAQEDSFSKDEIISAYTRSRVQQITGATNNLQRRSGNILPPPADDYCNNSTASTVKPIVKSAPSLNPDSQGRGSPPSVSSGRSIALPASASWGSRVSNFRPSALCSTSSNRSTKQNPDSLNDFLALPSEITSTTMTSTSRNDVGKNFTIEESQEFHLNDKLEPLESSKLYVTRDCQEVVSDPHMEVILDAVPSPIMSGSNLSHLPASEDKDSSVTLLPNFTNFVDLATSGSGLGKDEIATNGGAQKLCSGLLSMRMSGNGQLGDGNFNADRPKNSVVNHLSVRSTENQRLQQFSAKKYGEPTSSSESIIDDSDSKGLCVLKEESNQNSDSKILEDACGQEELDRPDFGIRSRKDEESASHPSSLPYLSHSLNLAKDSSYSWSNNNDYYATNYDLDLRILQKPVNESCLAFTTGQSVSSNGYVENKVRSSTGLDGVFEHPSLVSSANERNCLGNVDGNVVNIANAGRNPNSELGESSIISNILSMDFDAWDDMLSLQQNLTELLSKSDKQHCSYKSSSSWKVQNSNQSRFSFAREDDFTNQVTNLESSLSSIGQMPKKSSSLQSPSEYNTSYVDELRNGLSCIGFEESDTSVIPSIIPSNKIPVSRAQTSAPPGFSVPSRAPPPGFSSHERVGLAFNTTTGNHSLDALPLIKNQYQAAATGSFSSIGDVEFIDPAILAVGRGSPPKAMNNLGLDMNPTFPSGLSFTDREAGIPLLMQQSSSTHQNLRISDQFGNGFSGWNDVYGVPPRLLEQSQAGNLSAFAQLSLQQSGNACVPNGYLNGWNEVQSANDLGMAELLRNERPGFNKFVPGMDDSKFQMPSSGSIYNRAFGMLYGWK